MNLKRGLPRSLTQSFHDVLHPILHNVPDLGHVVNHEEHGHPESADYSCLEEYDLPYRSPGQEGKETGKDEVVEVEDDDVSADGAEGGGGGRGGRRRWSGRRIRRRIKWRNRRRIRWRKRRRRRRRRRDLVDVWELKHGEGVIRRSGLRIRSRLLALNPKK